MNFESYAKRIATLRDPDDERNKKQIVLSYQYQNENDQLKQGTICRSEQ